MAKYLDKFPKLLYTRNNSKTLITNLLTRIAPIKNVIDGVSLFYEYDIQEGDTPEIIASKYYEDAEMHWIILLFNDIYDPYYDWPMTYQQLQTYIIDKYGSIQTAKTTIHHYEKIIKTIDESSGQLTTNIYIIDYDTYMNDPKLINEITNSPYKLVFSSGGAVIIDVSKRSVDCFDYEVESNESKRKIKLIRKELVYDIMKQFDILVGV